MSGTVACGRGLHAPGARALPFLSEQGCPVGILTRNRRPTAFKTLEAIGLTDFFPAEYVLGRDEATET